MRVIRVRVKRWVAALQMAGEYERSGMGATSEMPRHSGVTGVRDTGFGGKGPLVCCGKLGRTRQRGKPFNRGGAGKLDLQTMVFMKSISARWLLVCLLGASMPGGEVFAAEGHNQSAAYRAFLDSLSVSERKLPIRLVATQRHAVKRELPPGLEIQAGQRAGNFSSRESVYRVDGRSADELVGALAQLGLAPSFVSASRAYVTAKLTDSMAVALSASDSVFKITEVVGPIAQGQGSTQAAGAHRLSDLYPADKPGDGDPALDGSEVVIGLISLPVKQADLTALDEATTRVIPDAGHLVVRTGDKAISHGAGALDAVDSANGSMDALFLLQLIYDMAPGATVVLASPGVNSVPGELATAVSALVSGDTDAGIPAANIIIDDLFYPDQNPFEIDEVSESIAAASAAGALYVTAAGDTGQGGSVATSAVYISDFQGIQAPSGLVAIDPYLSGFFVQSFGGDGLITLEEDLDRLCAFWSEKPAPGTDPKFTAWVYDASDQLVVGAELFTAAPGGCNSVPLSAGHKVVFDQGLTATSGLRLMVTGVRSTVPATLAYSGAVFDEVTRGNIRGHAAGADALTVAASDLCVDDNSTDYATCSARSISSYSSDGEAAGTARFFWESDGAGGYSAIANGLAVAKPDLSAAGQSILTASSGGSTSPEVYYGTSASAAVTAGIAALYWEYVAENTDVLSEYYASAVRDLLSGSAIDVGDNGNDSVSGAGILDAPKPLEDNSGVGALPRVTVTLSARSAGALLQFTAALDSSAGATYTATCNDGGVAIGSWTDQSVLPDTSYRVQATPESRVACTVTGSVSDGAGGVLTAMDSAAVTAGAVADTAVSFDAGVDDVSVAWRVDANIVNPSMLTVALRCTDSGSGDIFVNVADLQTSPYVFAIGETDSFDCSVTTVLSVNGGSNIAVGAPVTETVTASASSGLPIWLLYQANQP